MDADSIRQAVEYLASLPLLFAMAILFASSLLEYIFPPFPGDTVTIAGSILATVGNWSLAGVLLVLTAGALVGSWLDYELGRRALSGKKLLAMKRLKNHRASLQRVEHGYRKWGPAFLVCNRFLPGIRAFFFVAAGSAGIPLSRVLLYSAISALLWNLGLLALGSAIGSNLDLLARWVSNWFTAVWVLLLIFTAGWLLWRWRRSAN